MAEKVICKSIIFLVNDATCLVGDEWWDVRVLRINDVTTVVALITDFSIECNKLIALLCIFLILF